MVPEPTAPLRDRVKKEYLAFAGSVDISHLLNSPILPSKVLILLAVACLVWIGILSLAFMSFMGSDVTVGWIFAGALFLALVVWIVVMAGEFRSAMEDRSAGDDDGSFGDFEGSTAPLPRAATLIRGGIDRIAWQGRRFLPVSSRPSPRRLSRAERPLSR